MSDIRLQKVIAQAGVSSRRKAEVLITQGRVQVNGKVVTAMGLAVDPGVDVVIVDGRRLRPRAPLQYLLLHKPRGYVTTCEDNEGRPTVFDLIKRQRGRLFPVGRLDFNSEGALLLTNDGVLANHLLHPRYRIPRVYEVKVQGVLPESDLERLRRGVFLDDGKTLPARVQGIRRSASVCTLRMTLYEGRYRQIHRMLEHCGPYRIKQLQRVQMGPLNIAGLARGQSRHLETFEIDRLRQLCNPEAQRPQPRAHGRRTGGGKAVPRVGRPPARAR